MPPRIAMRDIEFSPALSADRISDLNSVATWMAGHAKVVVVFDEPFWRQRGLSGDVISQIGPLSEIHDASVDGTGRYALFGFFATPPAQRSSHTKELEQSITEQLVRLFGSDIPTPHQFIYKDWAADKFTATPLDQSIPNHHPMNQWSDKLEPGWHGRLVWSGSESARGHYNGYIEGALSASKEVLEQLPLTT